jgi:polysaccharide pyruvyl transferase WcaK-like protein
MDGGNLMNRVQKASNFWIREGYRIVSREFKYSRAAYCGERITPYIGWIGFKNFGDEILYDAHKSLFNGQELFPYRTINNNSYKVYSGYGILGGGTLINQSERWLMQLSNLQESGMETFCLGTGVSNEESRPRESHSQLTDWLPLLRNMKFVGVRGPISLRRLNEVGFYDAAIVGDSALALAPAVSSYRKNIVGRIGLNFGYSNETRMISKSLYLDELVSFAKRIIQIGYRIELVPVTPEDVASNLLFLQRLGSDSQACRLNKPTTNLAQYFSYIEGCDAFIGQKLHATIAAVMLRIPSIMVAYQEKCLDFMESVSMAHFTIESDTLKASHLHSMFEDLLANRQSVSDELDRQVSQYRIGLVSQASRLVS